VALPIETQAESVPMPPIQHRDLNPLGLLYAVHCDGDTRIEPGVV
jgi:hypothetical protein